MSNQTIEEKVISEWIQSNIDKLTHAFKDGMPKVQLQNDAAGFWDDSDVPQTIDHPGAEFFRHKALPIVRDYGSNENLAFQNNLCDNYFQFESSPGEKPKSSLPDLINENDPLVSILKPIDSKYFQDPRYDRNPICDDNLDVYKLSFDSVNASCEFLTPIIINIFLFDAKVGKRVSEIWTFVPKQFHEQLEKNEALSYMLKAPTSVELVLNRPAQKKSDKLEQLIDGLYLVCVFDRFFMKQAGAAVDAYYNSPKEINKKKAIAAIKEMNPNGWKITFAYSAHPVSKILDIKGQIKNIQFLKVISTETADEAFFFHKLNKERKKPKFIRIDARFLLVKADPNENIYKLRYYFNTNPFFRLKYQNEMLIRIKTVNLSVKFGVKGRNIVGNVCYRQGDKPLEILNHGNSYKTHCQYHSTNPKFFDEFIINLPYPLTDDIYLDFKFYHIESKIQASPESNSLGTVSVPLLQNGHIICDGEHKVNIVDTTGKTSEQKSSVVFEVITNSSLESSNISINEMLKGDYTHSDQVDFFSIAKYIEPLLDQLMKDISEGNRDAFNALLNVISQIPCDEKDSRYIGKIKEAYQDCKVRPQDLLYFYIQKCALHNVVHEKFFNNYISFWLEYAIQPITEKRSDIYSSFFLLDILLKCTILDKNRIFNDSYQNLIRVLHKSLTYFRSDKYSKSYIGHQLNISLALFYKDLCEFCDRGCIINMISEHISELEVSKSEYDRRCFIDFFSCFLWEKTLLIFCIPLSNDNVNTCAFCQIFLPTIEELLKEQEQTHMIFAVLFSILTRLTQDELKIVAKGLTPIINIIGRNIAIVSNYEDLSFLIFPFIIILFILSRLDFSKLDDMIAKTCHFLTQIANRGIALPKETKELEGLFEGSVYMNVHSLKLVKTAALKSATINTHQVWKIIGFLNQLICIRFIELCNTVDSLNDIITPLYDVNVSNSLFQMLKEFTIKFIENNKLQAFKNSQYRIYKLVLYLVKNLSKYNVEIIDKIWNCEEIECKTHNRTTAFFMYGIRKYGLTESQFQTLTDSKVYPIAKRYMEINNELKRYNEKDENHHDLMADCLLEMADFYIPSPDCRVQVLLELAQLHLQYQYASEAAVAQLTAAALVAEYLRVLGRLPNVFSDSEHPAKSFISASPSASKEICPDELMNDLPQIPGFCSTKYFCECGLIFIIQTSMDTCKRAQLFELSTKVHSLLRPLIEYRHLWRILEKHFQNGELSWLFLDQFGTKTDRSLGTYFRVEYQTGEIYIYREAQLMNLWQFSEKIKKRLALVAGEKEIVICNDGAELNPDKFEEGKFYIHVKAVEQYFTPEERKTRVTVFEQNHNVNKFYFDLPYSKTAQSSIEYCYLKRTIFKLPNPIPYIVSRVRIPNDNIEHIEFTPIEYSCQNLQKQVDNITDATKRKDFTGLQLLLQGSLLVQVNEGPKKVAETFLTGAREDNNTATLRKIFREFLKANETAVKLHDEYVMKNPVFRTLQDEMEIGLNRLSSSLQPFLK